MNQPWLPTRTLVDAHPSALQSRDARPAWGAEIRKEGLLFHLILNAYWEPLEFELPRLERGTWRRWIDTALDSPEDIVPWDKAPPVHANAYRVADRSVVMLYRINKG